MIYLHIKSLGLNHMIYIMKTTARDSTPRCPSVNEYFISNISKLPSQTHLVPFMHIIQAAVLCNIPRSHLGFANSMPGTWRNIGIVLNCQQMMSYRPGVASQPSQFHSDSSLPVRQSTTEVDFSLPFCEHVLGDIAVPQHFCVNSQIHTATTLL